MHHCATGGEEASRVTHAVEARRRDRTHQRQPNLLVIDCREPHEYDITHIVDRNFLYPRSQWQEMAKKLRGHEKDQIIVHCRSGARSLQVAQMLRHSGFDNAMSMAGGILLWNRDVNPGAPQY